MNLIITLPQVQLRTKRDETRTRDERGNSIYKTKEETVELPDSGIGVDQIIAVDMYYMKPEFTVVTVFGGADTNEHIVPLPRDEVIDKINSFIRYSEYEARYLALSDAKAADC